jgi:hypothetical protein
MKICYSGILGLILLLVAACQKLPTQLSTVQRLCPNSNPVYIDYADGDSAVYYIPNCFTPGDSSSVNDSLTEYTRNIAQAMVTITDSLNNIIAYNNYAFPYPGFSLHKVWDGNYNNSQANERCYVLNVRGTTMFGNSFTLTGSVSLLRYFFGDDTSKLITPIDVRCDSCTFNSQWSGSNFNRQLPSGINFVPDTTHHCYN